MWLFLFLYRPRWFYEPRPYSAHLWGVFSQSYFEDLYDPTVTLEDMMENYTWLKGYIPKEVLEEHYAERERARAGEAEVEPLHSKWSIVKRVGRVAKHGIDWMKARVEFSYEEEVFPACGICFGTVYTTILQCRHVMCRLCMEYASKRGKKTCFHCRAEYGVTSPLVLPPVDRENLICEK